MIDIHNLSFGYNRRNLLYRGLSLNLPEGNIYGLLGKNGAGKSTFLKNIAGLLFPDQGRILVDGAEPRKRAPSFLRSIYLIPEEVNVPGVSVSRYCQLFAPFYTNFNQEHFYAYLDELQVARTSKLGALSFGQQKKFIIAFALACNTKVLLLDEPTNGLDIPSKAQFRRLIASVMDERRTIFISTHQIRDLDNLIDRVVIVDNGELLLHASITDIAARLVFRTVPDIPEHEPVLYSEEVLNGYAIVQQNKQGLDTKVNLEQLFNAVTQERSLAKSIFQS